MRIIAIRRVGLPVAAAFALLAGATTSVQAATIINQTIPTSGTVTNPCNGELVTFSGTAHALLTYTQAANGGFSGTAEANFADVTGTDASGDTYHVLFDSAGAFSTNGASTATIVGQESLVTDGSTPNARGYALLHETFNANGQPTASIEMTSLTCTG